MESSKPDQVEFAATPPLAVAAAAAVVRRKRLYPYWEEDLVRVPGSTTGEENADTSDRDEFPPLRASWSWSTREWVSCFLYCCVGVGRKDPNVNKKYASPTSAGLWDWGLVSEGAALRLSQPYAVSKPKRVLALH
ncbi:hypothetical protein NHX12_003980 [Muraenolepis orangiensis]|uniref:Uncharacterized protein n=1 Tax=Muraenolepis orangiensis TaxID=630683 RepID=A0A9Q0IE92_9TELE|nr:hypothetical protein NHX12_003980 [Muraenolepis orangiensis]